MGRTSYATKPTPFEQSIIDGATSFSAYIFVGRNTKRTVPCGTRGEAERTAQRLANEHQKPALVYAVKGGSQAYLMTIDPERKRSPRAAG